MGRVRQFHTMTSLFLLYPKQWTAAAGGGGEAAEEGGGGGGGRGGGHHSREMSTGRRCFLVQPNCISASDSHGAHVCSSPMRWVWKREVCVFSVRHIRLEFRHLQSHFIVWTSPAGGKVHPANRVLLFYVYICISFEWNAHYPHVRVFPSACGKRALLSYLCLRGPNASSEGGRVGMWRACYRLENIIYCVHWHNT